MRDTDQEIASAVERAVADFELAPGGATLGQSWQVAVEGESLHTLMQGLDVNDKALLSQFLTVAAMRGAKVRRRRVIPVGDWEDVDLG